MMQYSSDSLEYGDPAGLDYKLKSTEKQRRGWAGHGRAEAPSAAPNLYRPPARTMHEGPNGMLFGFANPRIGATTFPSLGSVESGGPRGGHALMDQRFVHGPVVDPGDSRSYKVVEWFYFDNKGEVQGPFEPANMQLWYQRQYFSPDLPVRATFAAINTGEREVVHSGEFMHLADFIPIFCKGDFETPFLTASYQVEPTKRAPKHESDPAILSMSRFNIDSVAQSVEMLRIDEPPRREPAEWQEPVWPSVEIGSSLDRWGVLNENAWTGTEPEKQPKSRPPRQTLSSVLQANVGRNTESAPTTKQSPKPENTKPVLKPKKEQAKVIVVSRKVSDELKAWCNSQLHQVVEGGVDLEQLLQIMAEFDVSDSAVSETTNTLASMVLDLSTHIDSRSFASEFVKRRRQDLEMSEVGHSRQTKGKAKLSAEMSHNYDNSLSRNNRAGSTSNAKVQRKSTYSEESEFQVVVSKRRRANNAVKRKEDVHPPCA